MAQLLKLPPKLFILFPKLVKLSPNLVNLLPNLVNLLPTLVKLFPKPFIQLCCFMTGFHSPRIIQTVLLARGFTNNI